MTLSLWKYSESISSTLSVSFAIKVLLWRIKVKTDCVTKGDEACFVNDAAAKRVH